MLRTGAARRVLLPLLLCVAPCGLAVRTRAAAEARPRRSAAAAAAALLAPSGAAFAPGRGRRAVAGPLRVASSSVYLPQEADDRGNDLNVFADDWLDRIAMFQDVEPGRMTLARATMAAAGTHQSYFNSDIFVMRDGRVMKEATVFTEEEYEQAMNEASALELFAGPGVVRLLGVTVGALEDRDDAAVVTKILEGADGNLRKMVIDHDGSTLEVSKDEKVRIFIQILRALRRLESAGWAHRDVKPANVLVFGDCLAPEGCRVKLADFEYACYMGTGVQETLLGSPLYMAPELWTGDRNLKKIDVWSAGILGFELFTGMFPDALIDGTMENSMDLERHPYREFVPKKFHIAQDPEFKALEKDDKELAGLLRGMLTKAVWRRFTFKQALEMAEEMALRRGIVVPEEEAEEAEAKAHEVVWNFAQEDVEAEGGEWEAEQE